MDKMIRIKNFLLLSLVAVALSVVGCNDNDDVPKGESVVTLDTYELNIDGGGGDIPIFYGVENGLRGVRPNATVNVDWMSIKEVTDHSIVVSIKPSDINEERYGIVTVSYKNMAKNIRVFVTQDKQLLNKFSFEVLQKNHNSCTIKYKPTEKGRTFMANIIDAEYFRQSGISDLTQFIANEMASYRTLAERNQLTLEELLTSRINPQLIYKEEVVRTFENMQPGASYVVYAYGVSFKGNEYTVTIPMHQYLLEIPMPELYDVSFDVSVWLQEGYADISISPKNWSGYYVVQLIPETSFYYVPKGERLSDTSLRAMSNDFYKQARQAVQGGVTVDAFLKGSCQQGNRSIKVSIDSNTRYMIAIFAVESKNGSIPVMCSMPYIAYM